MQGLVQGLLQVLGLLQGPLLVLLLGAEGYGKGTGGGLSGHRS